MRLAVRTAPDARRPTRGVHPRLGRAAATVLALSVVLGACGGLDIASQPVVGPLFDGSKPTAFCLSAPRGRPVVVGWDLLLEDPGSPAATIVSVTLSRPEGVRLAGALAVPVRGEQLLGNGWDFPLTARQATEIPEGVDWGRRRPAVGALITPVGESGVNLVVGVATTGPAAGSAAGLAVTYEAGGHRFVLDLPTAFTIKVSPARC